MEKSVANPFVYIVFGYNANIYFYWHSFYLIETLVRHGILASPTCYQVAHKGLYSERDSVVKVHIDTDSLQQLVVRVQQGDVRVSKDADVKSLPTMDLTTAQGHISKPQP